MWDLVVADLHKRGTPAVAVDLPTVGPQTDKTQTFHDDAAHLRSVLQQVDGPVTLCANSYGGVVITEASAGQPPTQRPIHRLVYLAAFMPDADENVSELMANEAMPEFGQAVEFRDGRIVFDPSKVQELAMQQAPPEVAATACARLQPMAMGGGAPFVTGVGWKDIPATYVVCTEDRSLKPDTQRRWASTRAATSYELPFDHCPQLSHPGEIADLLTEVAKT
jgi:pimeloyl-ACP methyl ester carboxylesterase